MSKKLLGKTRRKPPDWPILRPWFYGKIGALGGMAEWLKAPVLKTGMEKSIVGSNPSPSAFPLRAQRVAPGEVPEWPIGLAC